VSALGPEAAGQFAFLGGPARKCKVPEGFRCNKIRRCAQLSGCEPENAALEGDGQLRQAMKVERDVFRSRAASAADGTAGQDQVRSDGGNLAGPVVLLASGELRHVRQVLSQLWVPVFEGRKQFVADAVAGEGEVLVSGVLAPVLANGSKVSLNFGSTGGEQRTKETSGRAFDHRVDAAEAFGPGTAQEFGEDGLGLIVAGMSGGEGVDDSASHERSEPAVAKAAGSFFDGLGRFAGACCGFKVCVYAVLMKWQAEQGCKIPDEREVGVGLFAAETMVQVSYVQDEAAA
jgi:hypothetical protein